MMKLFHRSLLRIRLAHSLPLGTRSHLNLRYKPAILVIIILKSRLTAYGNLIASNGVFGIVYGVGPTRPFVVQYSAKLFIGLAWSIRV